MYRMLFLALKKVQMAKNTPFQIPNTQQKIPLPKFSIAPAGYSFALLLHAISKSMNLPFVQKESFWGKLTNISITPIYLLFSSMLCFIKNCFGRSWDVRLHTFGANCTQIPHIPQKGTFLRKIYSDIFGVTRMYHH